MSTPKQPVIDRMCDLIDKMYAQTITTDEQNEYNKLWRTLNTEECDTVVKYSAAIGKRNRRKNNQEWDDRNFQTTMQLIARGKNPFVDTIKPARRRWM